MAALGLSLVAARGGCSLVAASVVVAHGSVALKHVESSRTRD